MTVNSRQYITITPYLPPSAPPPNDPLSFQRYLLRQFQNIAVALRDLTEASRQVLDAAPVTPPRFGAIRVATGAWATALVGEGWYGYSDASGGTWKLIKAA